MTTTVKAIGVLLSLAGVGLLAGCNGGGGGTSGTSSNASTASNPAPTTSSTTTTPVTTPASSAPALTGPRALHSATLLASGQVLVVGGIDATGAAHGDTSLVTASAVTPGGRLLQARVGHTATLLSNGKVLIAGGQASATSTTALNTTEIYDPLANAVTAGPTLGVARSEAVAVAFGAAGAQKVLIAGGSSGATPLASAEIYDVTAGTISPVTAAMSDAHAGAGVALLDDGTILVAGGTGNTGAAGADLYDPTTGAFTAVTLATKRVGAAFASTGKEAVIAGGQSATGVDGTTEEYAIASRTFAVGATLTVARRDATASVLAASGAVVIVGGRNGATVAGQIEVLSGPTLAQGTISSGGTLKTPRWGHTATALTGGQVVVVGGFDASGVPLASIESFTPTIPAATTRPGSTAPGSTATTPGSGSGSGLGGLLGSLLGGAGGGSSSGLGGLLGSLLGGGSTGGSGGAGSGLGGLLGGLLGGGGSGGSGGGFSSILTTLLSSLFGGSSSSGSGSGLGGLLGGLFGGTPSTPSSGGSGSGLGGLLGSIFGGGGSGGGLGGLLGGLFGGSGGGVPSTPPPAPAGNVTYSNTIQGLLTNCTQCHVPGSSRSDLTNYNGVVGQCTPGNPTASTLVQKVYGNMGQYLNNQSDAATIYAWVQAGCPQ